MDQTSKWFVLREKFRLHPAIYRPLLRRAYPVVLGMLSFTLLSVVDTAMLGRLGAEPLAAAGIASVGFFAIVFSLAGIGIGVRGVAARLHRRYPDFGSCSRVCETHFPHIVR